MSTGTQEVFDLTEEGARGGYFDAIFISMEAHTTGMWSLLRTQKPRLQNV